MAERRHIISILLTSLYYFSFLETCHGGMLYPRESESRQIQELNGMWNFRADYSANRSEGLDAQWYLGPLSKTGSVMDMPVPSSYNDITADKNLQLFIGWVWYDREFYVSSDWSNKRVVLRVDSAHYNALVWVNGASAMSHSGGHLPFETEVNDLLNFGGVNRVTIAVNNTLTPHTLPPGTLTFHTNSPFYPPGYFVQNLQFDFFNYAGIHRKVSMYTTPATYVEDIDIVTRSVENGRATMDYQISAGGNEVSEIFVKVLDREGQEVANGTTEQGELYVNNARLWWPYTMNLSDPAYLYTLEVTVKTAGATDIYRLPFGIRTLRVTDTQMLINELPFYCHGVAKHEDADIRGKGLDYPLIARDFHMMKWMGVNCFRTSHYPYAEEIMDQADKQGFVVIDECPGVGITQEENFSNISLAHHLEVMSELVTRDKNRPSVVMWSIANEPESNSAMAEVYFKQVIDYTRELDPTRFVTFVSNQRSDTDVAAKYTDIQCINRYYAWYDDVGRTETIAYRLPYDLEAWYSVLNKPLMIAEYGADTVAGMHTMPNYIFTEEFQVEFLEEYQRVFDVYKNQYLIGEMVWNFADFMTDYNIARVVGNKKGLLTRTRQPKASAHLIRQRYWGMINATRHKHDEL